MMKALMAVFFVVTVSTVALGDDADKARGATVGASTSEATTTARAKDAPAPWWSSENMKKNWGEWVGKFAAAQEKLAAAQKAVKSAKDAYATEKDRAKRQEHRGQILVERKTELTVRIEWYQLHVAFREAQHKKAVESYEIEAKTRAEQIKKLQDQLAAMK
ncbi:MAG: hypothetical protein HYY84_06555 [Deltaproteobacteria bacterium]|nr:hypothetical protein [Deltaproteobacteria bacterium]